MARDLPLCHHEGDLAIRLLVESAGRHHVPTPSNKISCQKKAYRATPSGFATRKIWNYYEKLWDSELVVLKEYLEEIVCFPMQKKAKDLL